MLRRLASIGLTLLLLLLPATGALAANVAVNDVRVGQAATYTRVVIEATGSTTYTHTTQTSPDRIVVDVSGATLGITAGTTDVDDGTVRSVTWSQLDPNTVRVVIETEVAATYSPFTLTGPFRIVVDVNKQQSVNPAPTIRVGLLWQQPTEVAFSGTGSFTIINKATGGTIATGSANTTWKVRPAAPGYTVVNNSGVAVGTFTGPIRIKLTSPTTTKLIAKSLQYRGEFEVIKNASGQIALLNELDMESYLYGVVPKEMPSSWHANALRAQAIAARTYSKANLGRRASEGFDLFDSTADQVYGGFSGEVSSTNTAVNDTRGTVGVYNGTYINALFHSTAGGSTENVENALELAPQPYLVGVTDGWDTASPHYSWNWSITMTDLQTKLNADPATSVGTLTSVTFRNPGVSGRWTWVDIVGSGGTKTVMANTFRIVVGAGQLKSTLFTVTLNGSTYNFSGHGYGHGVGMPQYSAKGMADAGYGYRKILRKYYTDGTRFKVEY